MSHTDSHLAAWQELMEEIRALAPNFSILPDAGASKLQIQITEPASNRQAMLNFDRPPDMIIHLDDQNVSASGGTSAFGIEMARFVDGKFDLMRRRKQLAPKELAGALVRWLQHGTMA